MYNLKTSLARELYGGVNIFFFGAFVFSAWIQELYNPSQPVCI